MSNPNEKLVKGGAFLIENLSAGDLRTPEDFTNEHQMIAKTTEEFVSKEVLPRLDHLEKQEFDHAIELMKKAGKLGLLGADIQEDYGGLELDQISSALISEKFARGGGGFSITHGAHVGIGSLPIVFFGNEKQKKKYLPKLATGELLSAYALTEAGSGSDALSAKTTAVLNEAGTHYLLNGEKQFITNAAFADLFIVYGKIDGKHFSAFIVEKDDPGVSTGPEEQKMGIRGSSTRPLILNDAKVPVENVLGEIGKGHKIAFNILNVGRYKLAIGAVGAAKRALEIATTYVNERKQFQTPLSQFSLTKEKLATMATEIYANESSVYRTVGLFSQRLDSLEVKKPKGKDSQEIMASIAEYQIECSINKIMATEMLDYVIDEAVQLHGGNGFIQEYEVERMYRDSRINRIFEGTNEINRLLIPGRLLKKAMKGELPLLQEAEKLQEELVMKMPEEVGTAPLEQEKYLLKNAKKVVLFAAAIAVQKHMQKIENEQEILSNLASMTAEVYNMEAAILRTEKAIKKEGEEKQKQKLLYTQVYGQEAFNRIEKEAREIVAAVEAGDSLRLMLSSLRKLTRHFPIDVIAKKREIAAIIIEQKKYVV